MQMVKLPHLGTVCTSAHWERTTFGVGKVLFPVYATSSLPARADSDLEILLGLLQA
jgi:hypothetical protein